MRPGNGHRDSGSADDVDDLLREFFVFYLTFLDELLRLLGVLELFCG
jgi:hypothetical protein